MRYEDASQAVSNGHSEPVARPDVDTLPAGSYGPATGNAISGEGTSSGAAGADKVGAVPATITEVQGAGGPAIVSNGTFQANGQYGVLSMDAQGNFNYVRNPNTPDGVKDVFNYTVADAAGASASTTLTIDIAQVAAAANGQGVVALPAGVELSDIHVNGRDLVINMPDGTQMVIPNGAVFVPEITIGDVQVPASNVAALLVDSEPQPAAGQLGEPGGNWNDPIPPLDPGVPLGDLIPPTEFGYKPPVFEQVDNAVDRQPTVIIETPDNPAGAVDASESVFEKGLPTRNGGEPAGSGEIADGNASNNSDTSEANSGTIVFTAEDGLDSITVNGTAITAVGQTIQGQYGTLTVTGIDLDTGQITYTYTLADNTSGDATKDVFTVVVTDSDGDQATGTLTVNIVDDVPTARNDTDSADLVTHVATGNVMTGADTTSGAAGADTVGADNAALTAISSNGTGQSDTSFDASGNLVVEGEFGTLVIKADGSYTYTLHSDAPGGSVDVFTYTLTDGDGDTSQATLTITNPDHTPTVGANAVVQLDDDALPGGNPGGPGDDPNAVNTSGTLSGSGGDGTLTFALTTNGAPAGFTYSLQSNGDLWVMQGSTHVLTITVNSATGAYDVTQVAPIMHPAGDTENNVVFDISYTVTDSDGDSVTGHLTVNVDDDTPVATNDTDSVDIQTGLATGNVVTGVGTTSSGPDSAGADGGGHVTGLSSNNESGHADNDPSGGGFVVVGEFGTLTMQADGSYSYQIDQNAPGGSVDVFTYSYTDADGDTTTATLTITNPDHQPTTGPNGLVIVDDDDVTGANGNPGGVGDETPQNTSGTLSGSGGDGALTFALTTSGAPAGFTYQLQANGDLWVLQGQTHVLTITVNASTGAYTVTEVAPIAHPAGGNENNVDFDITYTVTDSDGDHVNGTLSIEVNDDTPLATNDVDSIASGSNGPATGNVITGVDIVGGDANSTDGSADSPGADGFGGIVSIASNNVPANTDNTADGSGNFVVQGQYGTLTINEDGSYSYDRNPGEGGGQSDVFTYTYQDGDGDTVTATLTINIENAVPTTGPNGLVIVDDDDVSGANGNAGGPGDLDPQNTSGTLSGSGGDGSLTFALTTAGAPAGFSYALQGNGDLWVMQGATHVLTITVNAATGAYTVTEVAPIDHPAGSDENNVNFDITYTVTDADGDHTNGTLSIEVNDDTPLAVNDVDSIASGSNGPATGNVITGVDIIGGDANSTDGSADSPGADGFGGIVGLSSNNVAGHVDNDATGGFVVQGQYGTLTMQADGSYSYARNPGEGGGHSDVFTYTYVDGDGDTVSATLTINIENAVPTTGPNALVIVDDDDVSGANGNPGGTGDLDPQNTSGTLSGSGGDGSLTFALTASGAPAGFTYALQGNGDLWVMQGATHVLTITVNAATGAYTVTEVAPIDHTAGGNENNANFDITYTVTDSDGDHVNGTLSIEVNDDTPLAVNDVDSIAAGSNGPATGNVITGVDIIGGDANSTDGSADSPGADGFGGIVGLSSNNVAGHVDNDATGGFVVQGQYGTLTMQADGSYSYARNPGEGAGHSDVFTYTYVDGDGDTVSATLTINIGNAVPTTGPNALVIVDDDDVSGANGNPGGTGDLDPQNTTGTLSGSGGDGSLTFALTASGAPAGFSYALQGNGDLWVMQGATHVLTITVNAATGAYTVTEVAPIDHTAGGNENNANFDITYTVTDADGDHVNGTLSIEVNDDTPLATNDVDSIASGTNGPATGNVITGVDIIGGDSNSTDGSADSPGADGFGGIVGLSSNNVAGHVDNDATGGFVVQGQYGTLTMQADGSYSYARNPGQGAGQSDVFTYTYQDGDGDTVSATLTINIGNAVPTTGPNALVIVDDDDVSGRNGNPGGTGDEDPQNTTGTLSGSGGDGSLTFALLATGTPPAGFTYQMNGNDLWVMQGSTHVLTITVNASTGAYTVTEVAPISHAAGANENNVDFTINYQVTDADGDHAGGTLQIEVNDDTPINFTPVALTDTGDATSTVLDNPISNDGTADITRFINDSNNDPSNGENFIGADGFNSDVNLALFFTGTAAQDGTPLLDAHGTPLTSHGNAILLSGFGTNELVAYVDSGAHAGYQAGEDTLVFTATLDAGSGEGASSTYHIVFSDTIDDGSGVTISDFSDAPAGQNDWIGVDSDGGDINADNNNSPDILITPTNAGGSVNTSNTDIGNANQWIDAGEGERIDYVTDVARDTGQNEKDAQGYTFEGHYVVSGAGFSIMQVEGGGEASVRISAINDSDSGNIKTLSGSIVPIDVNSIVVTGDTTYTIIDMGDGTFVITGLSSGAHVSFTTVGGADFDAISVTNASALDNPTTPAADTIGGDPFAIGDFTFDTPQAGHNIDLSLGVTATDADGDTSTGTIDLTLAPAGTAGAQTNVVTTMSTNSAPVDQHGVTTHSLISSNDNGGDGHRAFAVAQNVTLMAALAVAGLEAEQNRLDLHAMNHMPGHEPTMVPLEASMVAPAAIEASATVAPTHLVQPAVASHAVQSSVGSSHHHEMAYQLHGAASGDARQAPALTELLHGSAAGHAAPANAATVTAHAVTVPSAQALAAAAATHDAAQPQSAVSADGAQHNEVVSKVVADALNGGDGHGPNIDGLLNSLPGHDAAHSALEALAAQGAAMAFHSGYGAPHALLSVEMVMQQHAPPAHG